MPKRLADLAHGMDTNCNESFNDAMAWLAPKNKVHCGTVSLRNRLSMAIGIVSMGLKPFHTRLFERLGTEMTQRVAHHLEQEEEVRKRKLKMMNTRSAKKARRKKKFKLERRDVIIAKNECMQENRRHSTAWHESRAVRLEECSFAKSR